MSEIRLLADDLVARCKAWGTRSSDDYVALKKENSRQYARPGIAENPDAQIMGRMGECAFCLWLEIDPLTALDWTPQCDSGFDVLWKGKRIDVKTNGGFPPLLMWPVTKNHFLQTSPADIFVLVGGGDRPLMTIEGWIGRGHFIRLCHVAPTPKQRLDPGTKYMPAKELIPMSHWHSPPDIAMAKLSIIHEKQYEYISEQWS